MTQKAYAGMERRAQRLASGLAAVITAHDAPWHVARVGARVEFICAPGPLHNGAEAARAHIPQVEGRRRRFHLVGFRNAAFINA